MAFTVRSTPISSNFATSSQAVCFGVSTSCMVSLAATRSPTAMASANSTLAA